jgi:hypothetical protein
MATPVWIVLCKQANDLTGNTLGQTCPQSQRIQFQTTYEVLVTNLTTTTYLTVTSTPTPPIPPLLPADVAQVWGVGFGAVMLFFLFGRGIGTVLNLIRNG